MDSPREKSLPADVRFAGSAHSSSTPSYLETAAKAAYDALTPKEKALVDAHFGQHPLRAPTTLAALLSSELPHSGGRKLGPLLGTLLDQLLDAQHDVERCLKAVREYMPEWTAADEATFDVELLELVDGLNTITHRAVATDARIRQLLLRVRR